VSASNSASPNGFRAVFWDFGGVFTTSPFVAFNRYEAERGLPKDFIRQNNARNPLGNAWAKMERNDITTDEFATLFEDETRELGHAVNGADILPLLAGDVQEEMVEALRRVRERYKTACLTNNMRTGKGPSMARDPKKAERIGEIMTLFDQVVESSHVGVRKPEPDFYRIACELMAVEPAETVFLDDLGINLKPAKAMGMTTIKVVSPDQALGELSQVLGLELR
jgi:putative hydrolase of the HAD superfamily